MTFVLRDYQNRLSDLASASLARSQTPCIVAPTGAGKTVLIAEQARRARERGQEVLITCHRTEILQQILRSVSGHLGEAPQVIAAGIHEPRRPITVAMVPTLLRRPAQIDALRGRFYLQDECHHATARSWQRLRERLAPAAMAGYTATPITATGRGLRDAGFDDLIVGPQPQWLIDNGFLAPYRMFGARTINTRGVHTRAGDFALDELEARVQQVNGSILRDWHRYNPDARSTICVGISVVHSQTLAELFRGAGVMAVSVDGSTPAPLREQIFRQFRNGEVTVLCACAVVDEGLDCPEATCLQLVRPTKSLRLYRQLTGRVLRPKEDGTNAIIIDHGGTWSRLPAPNAEVVWSLDQEPKVRRTGTARQNRATGEIETPPVVVQEDGQALVEVGRAGAPVLTPPEEAKAKAHKMLYADCAKVKNGWPAAIVRRHTRNLPFFEPHHIALVAKWGGLAPDWPERMGLVAHGSSASVPQSAIVQPSRLSERLASS